MNIFQLNTLRLKRIRDKVLIFQIRIRQSLSTQMETSHKQHESNSMHKKYNLRSCLPQVASSYVGSSLIEVLLLFVIVNVMLNLSLGILLISKEDKIQKNEIKEGCDIECVIKMDSP